MARISRKELKQDEVAEAAVDFGHWIEHNWPLLLKGLGAVAIVALATFGWIWMNQQKVRKAVGLLAQGQQLYEQSREDPFVSSEDLPAALELFEQAADQAGGSATGLVANYYRGASLLHLGEAARAVECLEKVVAGKPESSTLLSSAQMLLTNAYVEAGQVDKAVSLLTAAAAAEDGDALPAELALLHLGRIHQNLGDSESARAVWSQLVERYPEKRAADEARRLLGS